MTLLQILNQSGYPWVYRQWKNPPPLPYGVYYMDRTNNFAADGIVYSSATRYILEVYTENKQPETESALETVLTAAGIYWEKTGESYIETEQMQFTTYEIEV